MILLLFALKMIFGNGKPENEKNLINDYKQVTIVPLAIPSMASPDAIMAVVLVAGNHLYNIQQQVITVILRNLTEIRAIKNELPIHFSPAYCAHIFKLYC